MSNLKQLSDMSINVISDTDASYWTLATVLNTATTTYYDTNSYSYSFDTHISELEQLFYKINIDNDDDNLLKDNIIEINNNKMIFKCNFIKNRIQPYEYIMELINKKTKLKVKVEVSDILTIIYTDLILLNIENNFKFNSNFCDFSKLKVKFKYKNILYDNNKLSLSELRKDKLKKILENE